jgi:hypothetical protein
MEIVRFENDGITVVPIKKNYELAERLSNG